MRKASEKSLETLKSFSEIEEKLSKLHQKWQPHDGQLEAGRAIFKDKKRIVFLQCGRSWGKSEFAMYCAWRWAMLRPNQQVYIVGPFRTQQNEIMWASKRIQTFGPKQYLLPGDKGENKSELRLSFKNGSFIKILGADNPESLRGPKPHFVIFDEFKDVPGEAYRTMSPNLKAKKAPCLIIGTPPDRECFYTEMMNWVEGEMANGNPRYHFMEQSSYSNTHMDPEELDEERRQLEKKGEHAVWRREYLAQYVPGGANAIFPPNVYDVKRIVKPDDFIRPLYERDKRKINWYTILDPGTTTCFAALFVGINPYTSQIFVLDEIYEKDRGKTITDSIWQRVRDKENAIYDREEAWFRVADSAAAWFMNEILARFGSNISPSDKTYQNKEEGLSLIRSIMAAKNKLFISKKCQWLQWEIQNYVTDDEGRIPKKDDHLIDCFRYLLNASHYELNEDPSSEDSSDNRYYSMNQEMRQFALENDWSTFIDEPYYDPTTGELIQ